MLRIAVCDDDKTMLEFISKKTDALFTESGIGHTMRNFLSGAEFLKAHKDDPFDVVFLDIAMPGMSGFDVAKLIRHIRQYHFRG